MKPLLWKYSPVASIFVAFSLVGVPAAHAANDVWIGNTDANFATLSNWTGSVTPNGNTPVFGVAGTSGTTLNNDIVGASYAGLTFNSGASAYTIGGNSFTLTGNIVNNSTSLQTINNGMTFTVRQFNGGTGGLALGGTLTVSTALNTGAGAVTMTGATTVDGAAVANGGGNRDDARAGHIGLRRDAGVGRARGRAQQPHARRSAARNQRADDLQEAVPR